MEVTILPEYWQAHIRRGNIDKLRWEIRYSNGQLSITWNFKLDFLDPNLSRGFWNSLKHFYVVSGLVSLMFSLTVK